MRKHRIRTAEQVCIAYAEAVAQVRRLTALIHPGECERVKADESQPDWLPPSNPIEPCISRLFSLKPDGGDWQEYREASDEIEEEMCERCKLSLDAVRKRKDARIQAGAAKRAVEAVGKRLQAAAICSQPSSSVNRSSPSGSAARYRRRIFRYVEKFEEVVSDE